MSKKSNTVRKDGSESAIHDLKTQLKKMTGKDWKGVFLLAISYIPGKIWKCFDKDLWVVSEYENLARDNGFWFFKYLRTNYPDIKVYYPIDYKASDYNSVKEYGNVVQFGSMKHYCLFWAANKYIGTTKCFGFPYRRMCEDLVQWGITSFKYIFLNHGFTRGYSAIVDANETNYQLLITCSSKDSEIIIRDNGQPKDIVKCIGYARHDTLVDTQGEKKQILIMPTWRTWLKNQLIDENHLESREKFCKSEYYITFEKLLNDPLLNQILEKNNIELVLYLHEYLQPFSDCFSVKSNCVKIGTTQQYKIQELLKSSSLLITDYSSVCYDFAYMYKPVIYYQFDKEKFEKYQYKAGDLFSYERDGFGVTVFSKEELIDEIEKMIDSNFKMPLKYKERVDNFFAYHDTNNCKRIFEEISKL